MSETKVMKCNCDSPYQDEKYGKENRVHNITNKKAGTVLYWRCTVCGKEKI
jgi:hypothetical protein